jgi:hypothetical protein
MLMVQDQQLKTFLKMSAHNYEIVDRMLDLKLKDVEGREYVPASYYREVILLAKELNNKLVQQTYKDFDHSTLTDQHEG